MTDLEKQWRAEAIDIIAAVPKCIVPECSSGRWRVEKWEIDEKEDARLMGKALRRDPPSPEPWSPVGTYTRLVCDTRAAWGDGDGFRGIIMFDVLDELRQLVPFVEAATGSVLITGLGLGIALNAVLRKPEVTSVTVVDIDPEIIALIGPYYPDPRVTIVEADAWKWMPAPGQHFDAAWHDFWPLPPTAETIERLVSRLEPFADWQGVYGPDVWGKPYGRVR